MTSISLFAGRTVHNLTYKASENMILANALQNQQNDCV